MTRALHAEWTKMWTAPAALLWLVSGIVAGTALASLFAVAASCADGRCGADPAALGLAGVQLGQAPAALLAVLALGGEQGTGLLRATFTAVPRRTSVLAAKAVLIGLVSLAAGTVAVLSAVAAAGLAAPSQAGGPTPRAAAAAVLHLVLVALLALGVAAAIRDPSVAAGAMFALLYAVPLIATAVTDPEVQRTLRRLAPATASLPVLTAWSAASLLLGAVLLHRREP